MVTYHSGHNPTVTPDDATIDAWIEAVRQGGWQRLRTGALAPAAADVLMRHGFRVRQELEFLSLDLDGADTTVRNAARWRIGSVRTAVAVGLDIAAFGDEWAMDDAALDHALHATRDRRLVAVRRRGSPPFARPVGFCLTGASDDSAYLQRLAVVPAARRSGAAHTMVADAIAWAGSVGARRIFVNTDVDNAAALSLYERWGFVPVGFHLRVLERDLAT